MVMQVRRLISSSYPNQHQGWFLAFGDGQPQKIRNNVKRTLIVSCELSVREVDLNVFENIKWPGGLRARKRKKWEACLIMVGVYLCCCGNGIVVYTSQNSPLLWSGSWVGLAGETRNYCSGQVRMVSSGNHLSMAGDKKSPDQSPKYPDSPGSPLTWFRRSSAARNMTRRKTGCVSLVNKTLERCFLCQNPLFLAHFCN